jgi:homocysteine S-methyltransferase
MSNRLLQLDDRFFVTDGGLETTICFLEGVDLPHFAAFTLLKDPAGRQLLTRCYRQYAEVARAHGLGLLLETPTWRASADWAARLGYSSAELEEANREAVLLLEELRAEYGDKGTPVVISGNLGPRGDGYRPTALMSADEAERYHARQIDTFSRTSVDMVCAMTMTYAAEAIGVVRAARAAAMPAVISFTVETDGRLPSGQALDSAIAEVDAGTGAYAAHFMVNCAHPSHFAHALADGQEWTRRIRGIRANASRLSHAELDECTELDRGDPDDLASEYRSLMRVLPNVNILGGCCGTDHHHIARIAELCVPAASATDERRKGIAL